MLRFALLSILTSCALAHDSTVPFGSEDEDGVFLLQQRSTLRQKRPRRSTAFFVAGVEGSGHHFLMDVVQDLFYKQGNGTLPFKLEGSWFKNPYFDKATGKKRNMTWRCESRWREEDMDLGVEFFTNISKNEDYDAGTIWVTPPGCLSYPCGLSNPDHNNIDFVPRVDWLAEAAATAGVDLHVAFLYRPFEELLAANCIHRKTEKTCEKAARTLHASAKVLLGHLDHIHKMRGAEFRHQVQCLRYGDLDTLPQGLGNLFNHEVSFEPIIRDIWKPKHPDDEIPPERSVPNWLELVRSLRGVDAEMKRACERADPSI